MWVLDSAALETTQGRAGAAVARRCGSIVRVRMSQDFVDQYRDQLSFLRRSADAYDAGDESEAKRLALHARPGREAHHRLIFVVWDKDADDPTMVQTVRPVGTVQVPVYSVTVRDYVDVEPTLLGRDDPLAGVQGTTNAIALRARPLGEVTITGPGAGPELAGQGVLSDLIALSTRHSSLANA